MATLPDNGPHWWDREADDQGTPIRAHVRQAAHQLWPDARNRVRSVLGDNGEAAELRETTVLLISATSIASTHPHSAKMCSRC